MPTIDPLDEARDKYRKAVDNAELDYKIATERAQQVRHDTITQAQKALDEAKKLMQQVQTKPPESRPFPVDAPPEMVKDVSKFGAYLVNKPCTCDKPEFLCYPAASVCHCGEKQKHIHGKCCGGILQKGGTKP